MEPYSHRLPGAIFISTGLTDWVIIRDQLAWAFDEETGLIGRQTPAFGVEDVLADARRKGWKPMSSVCFHMMQETC